MLIRSSDQVSRKFMELGYVDSQGDYTAPASVSLGDIFPDEVYGQIQATVDLGNSRVTIQGTCEPRYLGVIHHHSEQVKQLHQNLVNSELRVNVFPQFEILKVVE